MFRKRFHTNDDHEKFWGWQDSLLLVIEVFGLALMEECRRMPFPKSFESYSNEQVIFVEAMNTFRSVQGP